MIGSLYYSSRNIPERCENSFVHYQKLQNKLRKSFEATYDTNLPNVVLIRNLSLYNNFPKQNSSLS